MTFGWWVQDGETRKFVPGDSPPLRFDLEAPAQPGQSRAVGVSDTQPYGSFEVFRPYAFTITLSDPYTYRANVAGILAAVALFALGGFIAYWTLDKALEFLIDFSGPDLQQVFQISKYLSLVGLMVAAFGVGLEFPVLLVFLQLAGVLDHRVLFRQWRLAIVIIVAVAAIITPSGDPISLAALSIPMVILYFVAALIGLIVQRRRERAEAAAEAAADAAADASS